MCLHTAAFMQAAMAMYEGVGFRRAPEFDRNAGELFGLRALQPPIAALAYWLDLRERSDRDEEEECKSGEMQLDFNQRGPQGPQARDPLP